MVAAAPAISVLLHSRSGCRGLAATLASLLRAGDGIAWELIAVAEQPQPLLEAFAAQRPHGQVTLLTAPAAATAAAARNLALARCRAPVVACLNADQRCCPERFRLPLQLLEQHSALQLVWGGWQVGTAQHQPWLRPHNFTPAERLRDPCLPAGALTLRRTALEALEGFRASLPAWSGVDLGLRLAAAGGRMAWLAEPLVQWRPTPLAEPWPVQTLLEGLQQLLLLHGEGLRPEQLEELQFSALAWGAGLAWQQEQPTLSRELLLQAALSTPLPTPRALAHLLEQACRSQRWCGGSGDPHALQQSGLWALVQQLWNTTPAT